MFFCVFLYSLIAQIKCKEKGHRQATIEEN